MSETGDQNPPQLFSPSVSQSVRPPPLHALSLLLSRPMRGEKAEGRLWLVATAGSAWRHYTVGSVAVEHVVVCSDSVPTCWTSQVLGLDKCSTGLTPRWPWLHTSTLHHTKLLTKLLRNEFQPNFCNYLHSEAKAVAWELDFYVGYHNFTYNFPVRPRRIRFKSYSQRWK